MKGILEFNLPEETTEFEQAQNGWKWELVVFDFMERYLRPLWKWGEGPEAEWAEKARDRLTQVMDEQGVQFSD